MTAAAPLLAPGPTRVVGILNVTPDSFSDGGRYTDVEAAVAQGLALAAEGAALVDVGGESTRPGAARVDAATELERVLPVVTRLVEGGVGVSVDTMRAEVAARCVEAGAVVVNDVGGAVEIDATVHQRLVFGQRAGNIAGAAGRAPRGGAGAALRG